MRSFDAAFGRCRLPRFAFLAVLPLLSAACATLQVPNPVPRFDAADMVHANREGIDLGVFPIVTEDRYLELFDDNLPEIGIVALWVRIHNSRQSSVELKPESWRLMSGNHSARALSLKDLFERYYDRHHVRMYSTRSDAQAREAMERITLGQGSVRASGIREGFVFFATDSDMAQTWTRDARLVARDIRLNRNSQITIDVVLSHAHP